MNKKLTLLLDEKIIIRAKNYADQNNSSLSGMVENFFTYLTGKALSAGKDTELPEEIDELPQDALEGFAKMWSIEPPRGKNVVRVMDKGKTYYFKIHEPSVLRSLTAVNQEAYQNWQSELLRRLA